MDVALIAISLPLAGLACHPGTRPPSERPTRCVLQLAGAAVQRRFGHQWVI